MSTGADEPASALSIFDALTRQEIARESARMLLPEERAVYILQQAGGRVRLGLDGIANCIDFTHVL